MLELKIHCNEKNKEELAEKIHKSLVGYEEYINSNILLNKDNDYITLLIGPDNNNDTTIDLDVQ